MNQKSRNNIKTPQLILGDCIFFIMCLALVMGSYFLNKILFSQMPIYIQIFTIYFSFYFCLCIMAILIPKVKPGLYRMKQKEVTLWFIGFNFGRIWHYPLILYPMFNSVLMRTIFLKCLGCKVPFGSAISSDLSIYDPHLIEIGKNVVIGMKSTLVPHYIVNGKLYLGKIIIGKGSLIGAASEITAGAIIGEEVKINGKTTIMPDSTIPNRVNIKNFSIITKNDKFQENQVVETYHKGKL